MIVPNQRPISRKKKISLNLHHRWMPGHTAQISRFESRAEFYFAALLEADREVKRYVPQPFDLRLDPPIGKRKSYRPDFYVQRTDNSEHVYEVTTAEKAQGRPVQQATATLKKLGMTYALVLTDSIYARSIEAENWLLICQYVSLFHDDPSTEQTVDLIRSQFLSWKTLSIDDLSAQFRHIPRAAFIGAFCVLAHCHRLEFPDIKIEPLNARMKARIL
ncbi:hypothetical protein [Wenzhouxiangella limi]|uniref:TnsA endonuclease N-terminal domain-containing protein n=1 Tax=Wenzhouxiangella limi TaxID=2707351 RepID=A0A845V455_9GAMM|nr:hypothetical protein [Wenzhouxiangella limi]NDY94755.1 hypothetical protein [Wenzhouxiangella limi]